MSFWLDQNAPGSLGSNGGLLGASQNGKAARGKKAGVFAHSTVTHDGKRKVEAGEPLRCRCLAALQKNRPVQK